jgi:hypothetical protein
MEYQQKNPLKYYALPFLSKFVSYVHKVSKNKFFSATADQMSLTQHLHYVNAFFGLMSISNGNTGTQVSL